MKEPGAALKLNEHDHGRKLDLRVGEEIDLRLEENPTTGFRWRTMQPGEPVCTLLDHGFEPGNQPGRPGNHFWRFRVVAEGTATIELAYRRSWEPEAVEARAFHVEVHCGMPV